MCDMSLFGGACKQHCFEPSTHTHTHTSGINFLNAIPGNCPKARKSVKLLHKLLIFTELTQCQNWRAKTWKWDLGMFPKRLNPELGHVQKHENSAPARWPSTLPSLLGNLQNMRAMSPTTSNNCKTSRHWKTHRNVETSNLGRSAKTSNAPALPSTIWLKRCYPFQPLHRQFCPHTCCLESQQHPQTYDSNALC